MKRFILAAVIAAASYAADAPGSRSAVLVELFTSEGCSSCPPADALLAALDPSAIVLSEHVDYWNHIGWTDPFSSPLYSARQSTYARRFGLEGVYTPQMVVDGAVEFVGSDQTRARNAIERAAHGDKANVRVFVTGRRVRVEVDALPASLQARGPGVYLVLASNETASQVLSGENGGRRLHHVAVVRSVSPIGAMRPGGAFVKEVPLEPTGGGLRVIAFVQERGQGKVLGAALAAGTFNAR